MHLISLLLTTDVNNFQVTMLKDFGKFIVIYFAAN